MVDEESIVAILQMYAKHGWKLRRVLLSAEAREAISRSIGTIFGDVEVRGSALNALWFSRRSRPSDEAWELRRITGSPFALVAVIADNESRSRENVLREIEAKMIEAEGSERTKSH